LIIKLQFYRIKGGKNIKKKIVGILVFTLLIIITVLPVTGNINKIGNHEYKTTTNNSNQRGWYYYPSYPNYAPSGIPDFSNEQENWKAIVDGGNGIAESTAVGDDVQFTEVGEPVNPMRPVVVAPGPNCNLDSPAFGDDWADHTYCHAVSLANVFWWFDSRYSIQGFPGDKNDSFPLVEDYGVGDDHSPENAPCLICEIANHLNITSKIYLNYFTLIEDIERWFENAGLDKGFNITDEFIPSFEFISEAIHEDKTVVLFIQFAKDEGGGCLVIAGHFLSCAGVNLNEKKIALSDPSFDIDNPSGDDHNDPQYVSYDIYDVIIGSPCSNYPDIKWWLPDYWPSSNWDYALVCYALIFECTNNVPNAPTIDGPTRGFKNVTYTYTFNSIDPDDNYVFYNISWGDGHIDKRCGPCTSGDDFKIKHTYNNKGKFTIQATSNDIFNEESNVSTLKVNIPRLRSAYYLRNQRIFELFPNILPLLRYLLR